MFINEISMGSGEDSTQKLIALAVSEFVKAFPLAPWVHFYSITGNADTPRKVDGNINAGDRRAIGSDYDTPKSNTPGFGDVTLKIYGDIVKTDIAHIRRGKDIGSQRALDLANFSESLGRFFMDSMFNDETDASNISGLVEQATELSRVVDFDPDDDGDGGELPSDNSSASVIAQNAFLEFLDAQIEDIVGGPDVIACNGGLISRLESIGRNFVRTETVENVFGIKQRVKTYKDIPLINAGFKANNSGLVIGTSETQGTSTNCTSMHLLNFGEEKDLTVATNVGLDVKDLGLVGATYQTLVELDCGLVVLNTKAFKQISGIILGTKDKE
jgi:hypothetical protein